MQPHHRCCNRRRGHARGELDPGRGRSKGEPARDELSWGLGRRCRCGCGCGRLGRVEKPPREDQQLEEKTERDVAEHVPLRNEARGDAGADKVQLEEGAAQLRDLDEPGKLDYLVRGRLENNVQLLCDPVPTTSPATCGPSIRRRTRLMTDRPAA